MNAPFQAASVATARDEIKHHHVMVTMGLFPPGAPTGDAAAATMRG